MTVGLPDTAFRRVQGLRREKVAQLAGVRTDYYTRLEQRRDLSPSEAVLDALARAQALLADFEVMPYPQRDLTRWLLLDPAARDLYVEN